MGKGVSREIISTQRFKRGGYVPSVVNWKQVARSWQSGKIFNCPQNATMEAECIRDEIPFDDNNVKQWTDLIQKNA